MADMSMADLIAQASANVVTVRSPAGRRSSRPRWPAPTSPSPAVRPDVLEVSGLSARADRRHARVLGIALHELTPQQASLEEAFMEMTRDEVEYHAHPNGNAERRRQRHLRERGMSTTDRPPDVDAALRVAPVTQGRVLASEWIKMRSLRSTILTLLAAVIAMLALAWLVGWATNAHWASMHPDERAHFNPIDRSLAGVNLAQLAIGVLGVLLITGEYATGMIRATFAGRAAPVARPLGQGGAVRRGHLRADARSRRSSPSSSASTSSPPTGPPSPRRTPGARSSASPAT